VFSHRAFSPIRETVERRVRGVKSRHVIAEFAPDDEFFEERIFRTLRGFAPAHSFNDFMRGDETEMEIRTEARGAVYARVIAQFVVTWQDFFEQVCEPRASVFRSAVIPVGRSDAVVYGARSDEALNIIEASVAGFFRAINFEFGRARVNFRGRERFEVLR